MQERADVAQKIISTIRKKRAKMIRGIERLCDAYITLAYMDASKHKTEKSEQSGTHRGEIQKCICQEISAFIVMLLFRRSIFIFVVFRVVLVAFFPSL